MSRNLSQLLDRISEFLAPRRGLLTLIGIGLIITNFLIQFVPGLDGLARTNTLLHLGAVVGLLGILLSQALG